MIVSFTPSQARGEMTAPPSKSMAHRLILCAGLSEGTSIVRHVDLSEDILATIDCLRSLGAKICIEDDLRDSAAVPPAAGIPGDPGREPAHVLTIRGTDIRNLKGPAALPCRECGSTLRFFIPAGLMSGQPVTLTGSSRLFSRPLGIYENICREQGLEYRREGFSLTVRGRLKAGTYEIPGNISSQFISGLLFVLPLLAGDSEIRLIPPIESLPYIGMTRQALEAFGIVTEWSGETDAQDTESTEEYRPVPGNRIIRIPGGQHYLPQDVTVEGDYSNAAFFEAFNLNGGDVRIRGLRPDSLQGDRVYPIFFDQLKREYSTIDLSDCPDLGPILIAAAARFHGARFTGTRRLRIKESDRGLAMKQELEKMGVPVEVRDDEILVSPGIHTPAQTLDGHNDHRIVMALSFLLSETGGTLTGAEAVKKSLPDFFERIRQLGVGLETH